MYWFTKAGSSTDHVGLNRAGRRLWLYRLTRSVPALESRAAAVMDTWTVRGRAFPGACGADPGRPPGSARWPVGAEVGADRATPRGGA